MALTREEINEIAKAVAEKIVTPQLVCGCGSAALNEAYAGRDFRDEIYEKNLQGVEKELPGFLEAISDVENSCHVTLEAAKESAVLAANNARKKDWQSAQIAAVEAENDILFTLEDKAAGK